MAEKTFLKITSPVQYVKGIGPKRSLCFKKLGVETVHDLLYFMPYRYVDYSTVLRIKDLKVPNEATIVGRIRLLNHRRTKNWSSLLSIYLTDDSDSIEILWFNRPDLKKKFKVGDVLIVSGKVSFYKRNQFVNPLYEIIREDEQSDTARGTIIPIYPLTEGLSLWDVRRAVRIALDECLHELNETLPPIVLEKHKLMRLRESIRNLHFPEETSTAQQARRRLVYDEFFFFELMLAQRKAQITKQDGIAFKETGALTKRFVDVLPFTLTNGQKEVIEQIARDMARERPMNRLLQGDVGSGKTVIALYAMLIALESNYQAVLMAPTEILAEQHFVGLMDILEQLDITPYLLTSSIKRQEKEKITEKINSGKARMIFGTHALIEANIIFNRLGLAVVDEQHRFGVMQRAALVNKGVNPDFLVLSATPIPRTLALTLYGDLDISTLKEKPPRRGKIVTKIVRQKERSAAFSLIDKELRKGRQAFVICPVIEKSEKMELKSVKEAYEEITKKLPGWSVGIVHGRLKTAERVDIMEQFRSSSLDILVATTVVEVGVDIPNATVMLIEHPERFGLAQLHQLRGRIGRGADNAYCFLFLDRYVSPETYERIAFFEKNNDGFALAQKDITLRGPGEILGKRQHGLPDIRIGDLEADRELLFLARDDAFALVNEDPDITQPQYATVRRHLDTLTEKQELLRIG